MPNVVKNNPKWIYIPTCAQFFFAELESTPPPLSNDDPLVRDERWLLQPPPPSRRRALVLRGGRQSSAETLLKKAELQQWGLQSLDTSAILKVQLAPEDHIASVSPQLISVRFGDSADIFNCPPPPQPSFDHSQMSLGALGGQTPLHAVAWGVTWENCLPTHWPLSGFSLESSKVSHSNSIL